MRPHFEDTSTEQHNENLRFGGQDIPYNKGMQVASATAILHFYLYRSLHIRRDGDSGTLYKWPEDITLLVLPHRDGCSQA